MLSPSCTPRRTHSVHQPVLTFTPTLSLPCTPPPLRKPSHASPFALATLPSHRRPPSCSPHLPFRMTQSDDAKTTATASTSSASSASSASSTSSAPPPPDNEDPTTARVRSELAADGVNLDELLNAGKVVNLTRQLEALETRMCSLPGDSASLSAAQSEKSRLQRTLVVEKRQVMQLWLKRLFLVQAGVFVVVGGVLANNAVPGWEEVPLVGQALGFWSTWLFTIPALRARKGMRKAEKSALNVGFVGMPFVNVGLPMVTRECGWIWAGGVAFLAACYVYYGVKAVREDGGNGDVDKEQGRVKGILKYLDWGSWR